MSRRAKAVFDPSDDPYPAPEPMPMPMPMRMHGAQHPVITAIMVVVAVGVFATLIAIAAILGKK